jgi:DNA primase
MASMSAREILDRTDLAALLTSLSGPPVGQGSRARWTCFAPEHPDDHPSLTMFVDRQGVERWRCWSDGHAGTAIDAVMIGHNLDVGGAMHWLEERAGLPAAPAVRRPTVEPARPLSKQLRRWANDCEHRLWQPEGEAARSWLHRRGLDDDVLRANRIGYDPGAHAITRARGLPRWRGITVCSFDRDGELAYVQVRNLDGQAPSKYSNPTSQHGAAPTVTFPRGGPVDGPVVVSEGIFDGLVVTQAGYRSAALLSTSSISLGSTSPAADEIKAHAAGQPIVLALDGDSAGRAASQRIRSQLTDCHVEVLRIPDNEDLTSLYTRTKETSCPTQTIQAATRSASSTR